MRKPGTRKLVYDKETKTIKKVRFNRFKRFIWWLRNGYIGGLIIILIAACFLVGAVSSTSADDTKKSLVKYEVKITVTYNALSIEDAGKAVAQAMRDHSKACNVEVTTKKVGATSWSTGVMTVIGTNISE